MKGKKAQTQPAAATAQPEQTAPGQVPEKKSKKLLWIIIAIVVIALIAGAYFLFF